MNSLTKPLKKTSVYLIRHAESIFNQACNQQSKRLSIQKLAWHEQMKNQQFCNNVCYNLKYRDCSISELGKLKCLKLKEKLSKNWVEGIVLVSPYQRALQTCQIVFDDLTNKVVVEPLLGESCRFSCDILVPNCLNQKKYKYPNFDFSLVPQTPFAYALTPQKSLDCQYLFQKQPVYSHTCLISRQIKQYKLYESNQELIARTKKVKQLLLDYSLKYDNIYMISHWYLLTYMLSRRIGEDGENLDYPEFQNCQIKKYGIEEIVGFQAQGTTQ